MNNITQIELPIGIEGEFGEIEFCRFCNHFNCSASLKNGIWKIKTDDAENIFWLGMNLNFKVDTPTTISLTSSMIKQNNKP